MGIDSVTLAAAMAADEKALIGQGAIKGEKGDPGETGPQGEPGPKGEPGQEGKTPVFTARNTVTGDAPKVTLTQTGDAQYAMDFTVVKGETGPQGERGVQGLAGPQGVQGVQGPKGDTGPEGPIGQTGPAGPQGEQGIQGPAGKDGAQGIQGVPGADGKSFSIQAQYATEADLLAAHATGNAGDAYLVGADNNPDLYVWLAEQNRWENTGKISGIQGPQGPKGDKGEQGEQGIQGIQGIPGEKGLQGDRGEKGDKGDPGDAGPQGVAGADGKQGPPGETGPAGAPGKDGFSPVITSEKIDGHTVLDITDANGTKKVQIPDGPKGDKGDTGAQGAPGVTLPENVYKLNEEVVIGTWVDGRPIYRNVFYCNKSFYSPSSSVKVADMPYADLLVNLRWFERNPKSSTWYPMNFYNDAATQNAFYAVVSSTGTASAQLMANVSSGWRTYTENWFIVEYTKTTDTPTA